MEFDIVDIDTQEILDAHGRRITQDTVDGLVKAVQQAKTVGRPSLTAPGKHSPTVTLRFSEAVNSRLAEIADKQGKPKSQVVRDAVDQYLTAA
jgi:hypothetical protein